MQVLAQLGSVDALQPNPLAGDDDGVAIDDRGRAGHVGGRRPGESADQQQTGENGIGGASAQPNGVLRSGAGGRRAYTVLSGSAGPVILELSDGDWTSRRARGAFDRHRRKDVKDLPGAIGDELGQIEVFLQENAVLG